MKMSWTDDYLSKTAHCLTCSESFAAETSWTWLLGLAEQTSICDKCTGKLDLITKTSCNECGRPPFSEKSSLVNTHRADWDEGNSLHESKAAIDLICFDCKRWKAEPIWDIHSFSHRALYTYNPFLQEILARFKYRGDTELAKVFKADLVKLAGKLGEFDLITTIPLNEKRQWERSFNQGELLAAGFSTTPLLKRINTSDTKQSKRTREERLAALKDVFQFIESKSNVAGKSILIIDDIYTTGATLRSAASVFYEAGAKNIAAVTVARATGKLV